MSTTIVKLHVLHSARDSSRAVSYILQLDDHRIMLDCGWDSNLSPAMAETYKKHARFIDAILISYPDVYHLGALPFLVGKCGLECPVYATTPIHNMGLMFMYEIWMNRFHSGIDDDIISLDDIDYCFRKMCLLKYSQTIKIVGSVSASPVKAGHMIGGTAWRIFVGNYGGMEPDEHIIYAVDYDHREEHHLSGLNWLQSIVAPSVATGIHIRPTLLITDGHGPEMAQRRKARDEALISTISDTVSRLAADAGDVLICSDTAGRVLEIMFVLNQAWNSDKKKLRNFPLVFLSHCAYNTVDFAKSMVEWMTEGLSQSLDDLSRIPSPRVIIAPGADLEGGFSRQLFFEMSRSSKNTIILTERGDPHTLAHFLTDPSHIQGRQSFPPMKLDMERRVPLEGEELLEALKARRPPNRAKGTKENFMEAMKTELGAPDPADFPDDLSDDDVIMERPKDIAPERYSLSNEFEFRCDIQQQSVFHDRCEKEYFDEYGAVVPNDYVENIAHDESLDD
ncbi:hypothetical protein ACOME3_009689 [Neoechinorhynchus agilis]